MKQFILWKSLLLITGSLISLNSWARPEYSLRTGINQCTACHVSPIGGGIRNTNGKQYGTHGYRGGKWVTRDEFSLDLRAMFFQPEKASSNPGGLTLMAAQAGVNLEISDPDAGGPEIRAVYSQSLGGLTTTPRDFYLRANTDKYYFLAGQFHAPFGIITDEHETYVKFQTASSWNNFEAGALISGDPSHSFHFDVSFVNGDRQGQGMGKGRALLWGNTLNVRWMPGGAWFPFSLGASYSLHKVKNDTTGKDDEPKAMALYGMFSVEKFTRFWVPMTFSFEYAEAELWNSNADKLINDPSFAQAVADKKSQGLLLKTQFDLGQKLSAIYQFEQLALDKNHIDDSLTRHSYGLKYWAAANSSIIARFAQSSAGHYVESTSEKRSNVDAFFMVFKTAI